MGRFVKSLIINRKFTPREKFLQVATGILPLLSPLRIAFDQTRSSEIANYAVNGILKQYSVFFFLSSLSTKDINLFLIICKRFSSYTDIAFTGICVFNA